MKSVNKMLSLVLCLTMVLSVFAVVPFSAGAAETDVAETGASSGTTGDCTWTLDDDGLLTISGNGAMGNGEPHPWGTYISKVIIEEGVTSIGVYAFSGCTGLTSVTIPDSVTSIGVNAFSGCTGLTSIDIPDSVTIIDDEAFSGCTGLTSIDIPDSVTSIGWVAFADCTGLTNVTIGNSVTSLSGDLGVFNSCESLTNVIIGSSVTSIVPWTFSVCPSLSSIKIAEDNPVYDSRDNCNAIIETETNTLFLGCKNTTIPDSVTSIDSGAFEECTGLTHIYIPDSVTSIGNYAFSSCTGLTNITIPDSVTSIGYRAFENCTGLTNIVIPDSVTTIEWLGSDTTHICCSPGSAAETYAKKYGNSYGHDYVLTPIDAENHQGVCSYCGDKTEPEAHTFTDSVCTSCGAKVESGTTGDCTWTLDDDGVLTISGNGAMGDYSYRRASPWGTNISKVIIEGGVTNIGDYAFYNCTGLTSVTIPDSVTNIGNSAFYYCTGLTSVTIPDSVTSINLDSFADCTGLMSVTIGNSVTRIYETAFYGCTSLTNVDIPDSVISIGETAFSECTNLETINIGSSFSGVTSFSDVPYKEYVGDIFSACPNLTNIKVSEDNTIFDSRDNCNAIIETETNTLLFGCKNTTIPNSVTSIGKYAFSGCTSLTSIAIPDSVSSIGSYAIPNTTHICCSPGSAAETYAKNKGNSYGHDYVLTTIDAENHQGVCSYCGDKTEPEAHTFTDGVCTSCGYKEPLIELVDGYFYIDGLLAKGKGAVEYAGDIYFVRNNGSVFTSGKLYVTEAKANGILTAGTYYFDAEGKLINSGVVGGYYFENRKIAKGAGLIEFENNIYYIRNDGSAAVSTKIGIPEAKTNGLISSGYYSFDEAGRLISDGIVDGYYYKDCVIVKGAGIVQFEGDLYYIRNDGSIFTSGRLYVTEPKTNGLIEAGTYRFDGDGKLIK